mmetsp:Transcript_82321/g.233174  ORF Transcript_82321/g.233174 Transcript_82321/m.233174 type:complete len:234 (+) Transcript_82321:381-1082(+)
MLLAFCPSTRRSCSTLLLVQEIEDETEVAGALHRGLLDVGMHAVQHDGLDLELAARRLDQLPDVDVQDQPFDLEQAVAPPVQPLTSQEHDVRLRIDDPEAVDLYVASGKAQRRLPHLDVGANDELVCGLDAQLDGQADGLGRREDQRKHDDQQDDPKPLRQLGPVEVLLLRQGCLGRHDEHGDAHQGDADVQGQQSHVLHHCDAVATNHGAGVVHRGAVGVDLGLPVREERHQ